MVLRATEKAPKSTLSDLVSRAGAFAFPLSFQTTPMRLVLGLYFENHCKSVLLPLSPLFPADEQMS